MVSNYWQFSFCRFLGSVFMNSKLCAAGSLRIHCSFIFHSVRAFYLDGHKLDEIIANFYKNYWGYEENCGVRSRFFYLLKLWQSTQRFDELQTERDINFNLRLNQSTLIKYWQCESHEVNNVDNQIDQHFDNEAVYYHLPSNRGHWTSIYIIVWDL